MSSPRAFHCFESRAAASSHAADILSAALAYALADRGAASFIACGGATPRQTYARLGASELDWARILVGLTDERWVAPSDPASNARFVGDALFGSAARDVALPMKTDAAHPRDAVDDVDQAYKAAPWPFDAALFGMGVDGHAASWFPGAAGLDAALDAETDRLVAPIDAAGSTVAGAHPLRLTLTLGAAAPTRCAVLLIFGDEKRAVAERAMEDQPAALPVAALMRALCNRLTVVWAP